MRGGADVAPSHGIRRDLRHGPEATRAVSAKDIAPPRGGAMGSFVTAGRRYVAVYCPRPTRLKSFLLLMSAWLTIVRKFGLFVR